MNFNLLALFVLFAACSAVFGDKNEMPGKTQAIGERATSNSSVLFGMENGVFASVQECKTKSSNCTGNGECKQTDNTTVCVCNANSGYVGPYCNVVDATAEFSLIFGTSLVLIIITALGVGLVSSADTPLSGGLASATGGGDGKTNTD